MDTQQIWQAVDLERLAFADILEGLSDTDWELDSLCGQWQVRDVAAHVAMQSRNTLGRLVIDLARSRGSVNGMIRDSAIRHSRVRTTGELVADVRATVGSRFTPIGTGPVDQLNDILVHTQDVAVPLQISHEMPSDAARVALERVWAKPFPFYARKHLAGYTLRATDAEWEVGDGPLVTGPAAALLMLATGRDSVATWRSV